MPDLKVRWGDGEREAFWTYVRGRMAEGRLTQSQVAEVIGLDRSVLARRLAGHIKDRPSESMVDQLGVVLRLDGAGIQQLRVLARYDDDLSVVTEAATEGVSPGDSPRHCRSGRQYAWAVALVALLLVVGAGLYLGGPTGAVGQAASINGSATVNEAGTVAGWVLFKHPEDPDGAAAWVTIWYINPHEGWQARSVQLHEGVNAPGCARYLQLADLGAGAGSCFEFSSIPPSSQIQVRVHYAGGLIRDYYADPSRRGAFLWLGVTHEE